MVAAEQHDGVGREIGIARSAAATVGAFSSGVTRRRIKIADSVECGQDVSYCRVDLFQSRPVLWCRVGENGCGSDAGVLVMPQGQPRRVASRVEGVERNLEEKILVLVTTDEVRRHVPVE